MPLIASAAVPVFESVTVCAALVVAVCWLPNARLAGDKLTAAGVAVVPVPERLTLCGLPAALSVMVTAPARAPAAAGVKVMLMGHPAPAASEVPQVLV